MGQLILTVTLNPAIDLTYHVGELKPGETHRVSRVDERLGGKGVNVASVLAQLGVPVVATGLLREHDDRCDAHRGIRRHTAASVTRIIAGGRSSRSPGRPGARWW